MRSGEGKQQGTEILGAEIRRVLHEAIEAGAASGDGDNGQGIVVRGRDVERWITNEDDRRMFSGACACFCSCRGDHPGSLLMRIAEAAESEIFAQAGKFQFEPADGFKIA